MAVAAVYSMARKIARGCRVRAREFSVLFSADDLHSPQPAVHCRHVDRPILCKMMRELSDGNSTLHHRHSNHSLDKFLDLLNEHEIHFSQRCRRYAGEAVPAGQ